MSAHTMVVAYQDDTMAFLPLSKHVRQNVADVDTLMSSVMQCKNVTGVAMLNYGSVVISSRGTLPSESATKLGNLPEACNTNNNKKEAQQ